MCVSVDSVLGCVVAEHVCGIVVRALVPDFADIKAAVACVACYADSGARVNVVADSEDALGGCVLFEIGVWLCAVCEIGVDDCNLAADEGVA